MHQPHYPASPDSPETEVVFRWLECEEGMQDLVTDLVLDALRGLGSGASPSEKLEAVGKEIRSFIESRNPLRGEVSLYSQLIETALDRVDWHAIAEWLMPEDLETGAAEMP